MNMQSEAKDREIERLTEALEGEKAQTGVVVRDLKVKLRYNRLLSNVAKSALGIDGGVEGAPILLLPPPDRFQP